MLFGHSSAEQGGKVYQSSLFRQPVIVLITNGPLFSEPLNLFLFVLLQSARGAVLFFVTCLFNLNTTFQHPGVMEHLSLAFLFVFGGDSQKQQLITGTRNSNLCSTPRVLHFCAAVFT